MATKTVQRGGTAQGRSGTTTRKTAGKTGTQSRSGLSNLPGEKPIRAARTAGQSGIRITLTQTQLTQMMAAAGWAFDLSQCALSLKHAYEAKNLVDIQHWQAAYKQTYANGQPFFGVINKMPVPK